MQEGLRVDAKRVLADSIIKLAKNMPLEKITIQKIVDNCKAVRRTFYNHFTDKYDLVNWIFKTNVDNIVHKYADIEPLEKLLGRILAFMKENQAFYSNAISTEGQNSFFKFFYQCAYHFYADFIEERFGEDALTDSLVFIIEYNCHGQVNLARQWMKTGWKESPELIAEKMVYNISPDLKKFFKAPD